MRRAALLQEPGHSIMPVLALIEFPHEGNDTVGEDEELGRLLPPTEGEYPGRRLRTARNPSGRCARARGGEDEAGSQGPGGVEDAPAQCQRADRSLPARAPAEGASKASCPGRSLR